jgi:hypothetical protein
MFVDFDSVPYTVHQGLTGPLLWMVDTKLSISCSVCSELKMRGEREGFWGGSITVYVSGTAVPCILSKLICPGQERFSEMGQLYI